LVISRYFYDTSLGVVNEGGGQLVRDLGSCPVKNIENRMVENHRDIIAHQYCHTYNREENHLSYSRSHDDWQAASESPHAHRQEDFSHRPQPAALVPPSVPPGVEEDDGGRLLQQQQRPTRVV